jgi:hypothetical protein
MEVEQTRPILLTPKAKPSAKPAGGLEISGDINGGNFLEGLSAECVAAFTKIIEEQPDTHVVVVPLTGIDPFDVSECRRRLLTVLDEGFPEDEPLSAPPPLGSLDDEGRDVSCPIYPRPPYKAKRVVRPQVYVVNRINTNVVFTLKDFGIYATPTFAFMVIDISPTARMPDFVGVMKGLAFGSSEAGRVRLAIQSILRGDNMLRNIVATDHAGRFQKAMPDQFFEDTLASLRVEYAVPTTPPKPSDKPTWKVFMTCPVGPANFAHYIHHLMKKEYVTSALSGTLTRDMRCTYCYAFDHSRADCPIRKRPDWTDSAAAEEKIRLERQEEKDRLREEKDNRDDARRGRDKGHKNNRNDNRDGKKRGGRGGHRGD